MRALPRARILLIDDEAALCSAMTRLLKPEHDVLAVTRVQEALDLLRSGERFDAILCDLMLPDMTGMAFFEALQSLPDIDPASVAFMTGGASGDAAQRFLKAVPNVCFYKPLDLEQLRHWLRGRLHA